MAFKDLFKLRRNPGTNEAGSDGFVGPALPNTREEAKRVSDFIEIGDTGLPRMGGYVRDEFLTSLEGTRGLKVFKEMWYNDAIVGGILAAFQTLMRQTKWEFRCADDSAEAEEVEEFVEGALFRDMETTWAEVLTDISTMFPYGFAPLEVVWKVRRGDQPRDRRYDSLFNDGRIAPRKLALRHQLTVEKWDFTEEGYTKGFWQQTDDGKRAYIPRDRFLLFRTVSIADNPQGQSLLRQAYRSYIFKKRIEEIEAIGAERDLAGLPIMRIPSRYMASDASAEEKTVYKAYQKLVTQIVRDQNEGLIIPSDRDEHGERLIDFELVGSGGKRNFDTNQIITRYNLMIATAVLADFIMLGQRAVGSFALASNKTDMFMSSLDAYLNMIGDQFNRFLLPDMMRYNGIPLEKMPRLVHREIDSPTIADLGTFISNLFNSGALGAVDAELVNALRQAANLPLHPEREDIPDPMALQTAQISADAKASQAAKPAGNGSE